ncbi:hypothetical protein OG241_27725 [Streptomyces sp. NBC_01390]|uniref:hypothetical protein n=1 Tax=Streptomyces sp. NBC_01390 TaxID=2903850 RepID=UPI0032507552
MTSSPIGEADTCGAIRASLFYRAPILSETGACILPTGHEDDHMDAKGARWNVIPLVGGADLDALYGDRGRR